MAQIPGFGLCFRSTSPSHKMASAWARLKFTLFSAEAAAARKKRLLRDVARSPIVDIKSILKSGGKFFPAPSAAITAERAVQLPEYRDKSIAGTAFDLRSHCLGGVSMLTICFSAYAELETFRKDFVNTYVKTGQCRMADVRPLMTRLKWMVFSMLIRSAATSIVPEALQPSFVVAYRPMSLLDQLDVPNYYGAYVYLVDRKGRVRWQASGEASPEELVSMHQITKQLLSEAK